MFNLKNIKSLFVVEDTNPVENNKELPTTEEKNIANTVQPKIIETPQISNTIGGGYVDDRILESLLKALEDNNIEGFDFLEYKNSIKALSQMPMDEATRYRSAYATAATLGVTLDKLCQSAEFYKTVLQKENEKFKAALSNQINSSVISKEKQAQELSNEILKKSELIKKLTEEITSHQTELGKIKDQVLEANIKIEKTKANFQSTFEALLLQINDDITKMKAYLK